MRHGQADTLDILQIAAAWRGTQLVMRVAGELDLCSAPDLRRALEEAAERMPSGVILDLERVSFMDAAGIRAILKGTEIFGPRLTLRRTPPRVMRLFTITGIDRQLTFETDSPSE